MKILITGCSKHSKGIIDCLKNNENGEEVSIVAADCSESNILRTGTDSQYIVPVIRDSCYIPCLLDICRREGVDILLPYITAELFCLAENKRKFEEIGVKVSVSSLESLKKVNSKASLARMFPEYMPVQEILEPSLIGGRVWKAYSAMENMEKRAGRICCKLADGCGGTGFFIIDDEEAVKLVNISKRGKPVYYTREYAAQLISSSGHTLVLQECIQGTDYSVCVLAEHGKVVRMAGYTGEAMEYGAVVSGVIEKRQEAYEIAEDVVRRTGLDGNACIDFMITDKRTMLLEVNPRINASLPFVAAAGVNMPYLRCRQLLGKEIGTCGSIKYGLRMGKYYETEYF